MNIGYFTKSQELVILFPLIIIEPWISVHPG